MELANIHLLSRLCWLESLFPRYTKCACEGILLSIPPPCDTGPIGKPEVPVADSGEIFRCVTITRFHELETVSRSVPVSGRYMVNRGGTWKPRSGYFAEI